MKYRYFLIIIFLFFVSNLGFAQSSNSNDNLSYTIRKVNYFLQNEQNEQALELIKSSEKKIKIGNDTAQIQIYFLYSKYYLFNEDYKNGKTYAEKAYQSSLKAKSELAKAYGLYAMAYYYHQLDMLEIAFNYSQKIINTVDIKKYPELAAQVYYRLYSIHTNWNQAKFTNTYADQTIKYSLESEDYDLLSNAYTAKGFAMENMYKEKHDKAYLDSVNYYFYKAANLDLQFPNKVSYRTSTIAKINLANQYLREYQANKLNFQSTVDSVYKYLGKIEIPEQVDKNYELRANILGIKSQIALAQKDYTTTENLLLQAYYQLLDKNKSNNFYPLFNISTALYNLYYEQEDYKEALNYLKINRAYQDSIFNKDKIREINSLEAKYENEKIKEKIGFLEEENKLKKIQNYLFLAICFLAITTLYFIRKNSIRKIQLQKERAFALEKEKAEAEAQVELEKEKQARLATERKILKLQNAQMQKKVMANSLQIERKNELLNEFKEKFDKLNNSFEAEQALKQENRIEKSLNETVDMFKDINPIFFEKLKELSDNKLTTLDLKYCAYFHLRLSTKEIAQIFNVEPKSIRMTKYRIKKKLNIPKSTNIEDFFEDLLKD